MNHTVENTFNSNYDFQNVVPKTNEVKKSSSFYDDYLKRLNENKQETESAIKKFPFKLSDLMTQQIQTVSQTPETTGSAIKKNIKNVLSTKYGELDSRNLFDDIDDKDVEDNIQTAENTIKTNVDRGVLSKSTLPKLPNLRDGLALSYAAANKGNSKAATRAREAAYMENYETLVKNSETNMLSSKFPRIQSIPQTTVSKPSTAKFMEDEDKTTKEINFVWKPEKVTSVQKLVNNSKKLNSSDEAQKREQECCHKTLPVSDLRHGLKTERQRTLKKANLTTLIKKVLHLISMNFLMQRKTGFYQQMVLGIFWETSMGKTIFLQ